MYRTYDAKKALEEFRERGGAMIYDGSGYLITSVAAIEEMTRGQEGEPTARNTSLKAMVRAGMDHALAAKELDETWEDA